MAKLNSGVHSDVYLGWLEKQGAGLPYFANHGTEDDVRKKMTALRPTKWVLEGNRLRGMTEMGEVTLNLPTDMILLSSDPDKNGLPQLKKIGIT